MVEIMLKDGVCLAERIVGVLSSHDDTGEKTYFVAQIGSGKRRLAPADILSVTPFN